MTRRAALAALGCPRSYDLADALELAVICWRRAFLDYHRVIGRGYDLEFQARARLSMLRGAVIALQ